MLSEEGLIVMVALVACALVILGALELISPTRPRRARHRVARLDLAATPPVPALVATALTESQRLPIPDVTVPVEEPRGAEVTSLEAPIERLLRAQAADDTVESTPDPLELAAPAEESTTVAAATVVEADVVEPPATVPAAVRSADADEAAAAEARPVSEILAPPARPARERSKRASTPRRRREVHAETTARAEDEHVPPSYEASHLASAAVRCVDEREDQALAALDRAEVYLSSVSEETLPRHRRRELERRLWWGYTKLGARCVERGRWDEALEPLLRALAFHEVGPQRHDETRDLLTRALSGMVEGRLALVSSLTEGGDHDGARAVAEMLRAVLDTAVERGLDRAELEEAFSRMDDLLDRVGAGR